MKKISIFLCFVSTFLKCSSNDHFLSRSSQIIQNCWENDRKNCVIDGNFRSSSKIPTTQVNSLPIYLKCSEIEKYKITPEMTKGWLSNKDNKLNSKIYPAFDKIIINGCRTSLTNIEISYGYELLPNCDEIRELNIEMFHSDTVKEFHCHRKIVLEILKFRHNEISIIDANSLRNLPNLREIYLSDNSIRFIDCLAFKNLPLLKLIDIENEKYWTIENGVFFEETVTENLRLIGVQMITVDLLKHFPVSMRIIFIADTVFMEEKEELNEGNEEHKIILNNSKALQRVSVINCALKTFLLNDSYSTIKYLNLSHNGLRNFGYTRNSEKCSLRTVDLSKNKLQYLPKTWLRNMNCIEEFILLGNNLKELSLQQILSSAPDVKNIDLRQNILQTLKDITQGNHFLHIDSGHLKISVDNNPWNCEWLQDFFKMFPNQFQIFRYKKLIQKVNVNGLVCQIQSNNSGMSSLQNQTKEEEEKRNKDVFMVSSLVTTTTLTTWYDNDKLFYDNSIVFKRNQRAEALVIIFLLPLGIAILFILLYMWIYCQKIFHWSYCFGRSISKNDDEELSVEALQTPGRDHLNTKPNMMNYELPFGISTADKSYKIVNENNYKHDRYQSKALLSTKS